MKLEATAVAESSVFPKRLRVVEDDLTWYFNWSEGELAAPSNYSAMVNAIRLGLTSGHANRTPDAIDNGRLDAVTKSRRIKRALDRLSPIHLRVLYAAFGPDAHDLPPLGIVAPLAPLTIRAQQAYRDSKTTRSIEDWLVRLTHRASKNLGAHVEQDRRTANAVAAEAMQMFLASMRALAEARKTT